MSQSDEFLESILRLYEAAEVDLHDLMLQAFGRKAGGSHAYYSEQARLVGIMRERVQRILDRADRLSRPQVEEMLAAAYQEAYGTASGGMNRGVNAMAVQMLAAEAVGKLESNSRAIISTYEGRLRELAAIVVGSSLQSGATGKEELHRALSRYLDAGVTGFTDRANHKWSLDAYVRMVLRTGKARANMEASVQGWRDAGVGLVRVSSHEACAPQCEPYQGQVLALSGGKGPRTFKTARGGEVTVEVVATLKEAIAKGYKHPNCRHTESAYIPGAPVPVVAKADDDLYKLEQKQRYYERRIRSWKSVNLEGLDPRMQEAVRKRLRYYSGKQRELIKSSGGRLRRNYAREAHATGGVGKKP